MWKTAKAQGLNQLPARSDFPRVAERQSLSHVHTKSEKLEANQSDHVPGSLR